MGAAGLTPIHHREGAMQNDIEALTRLNEEITAAENAGDLERLDTFIAQKLAFQRRDRSVVDRDAFLQTPRPGHRTLRIESVQVYGDRAVVACVVTDAAQTNVNVVTHNLRLFVRQDRDWKLLGWANAPVGLREVGR
jgi:Domain of unknown function (DUF4440)